MEKKAIKTNEKGKFVQGTAPGPGRPKDTEADVIRKKATKELISDYKKALGESLPLITPILIAKALEGDLPSIKEINDRVMGKADQHTDLKIDGEALPVLVKFVDGK